MKVRVLSSAPIFLKNNSVRNYPFSSRSSLSTSFSQNRLADVSGMRVSKTINHGNVRWRATASLNGKRRQRFFTSRDDARAWLDSIRTDHTGFWNRRTAEEQGEIVSAFKLASERGLSLHECVLSNNINGKPLPVADAINRYINVISQRSLRPSSLKQTQLNLSQLAEEFAGRMCHEVSAGNLEQWFYKLKWKHYHHTKLIRLI